MFLFSPHPNKKEQATHNQLSFPLYNSEMLYSDIKVILVEKTILLS